MRLALLLLLTACATEPVHGALRAGLDADTPPYRGTSKRIYPTTNCQTARGYLPYTRWDCDFYNPSPNHDKVAPLVNTWTLLTATRASIDGKSDTPLIGGWVTSHYKLPEPITHPWAPGCQLLLPLDTAVLALPYTGPPTAEHLNMGAWSEGPTAFLLIRPQPATLGHSFFVQFVEWAPGINTLGMVTGHAVQLEIGNSTWRDR